MGIWLLFSIMALVLFWGSIYTSYLDLGDYLAGTGLSALLILAMLLMSLFVSCAVSAFNPVIDKIQVYDRPIICATDVYSNDSLHYVFTYENEHSGTEVIDIKATDTEVYESHTGIAPHLQKYELQWHNPVLRFMFFCESDETHYMAYVPAGTFTYQGFEFNLE